MIFWMIFWSRIRGKISRRGGWWQVRLWRFLWWKILGTKSFKTTFEEVNLNFKLKVELLKFILLYFEINFHNSRCCDAELV